MLEIAYLIVACIFGSVAIIGIFDSLKSSNEFNKTMDEKMNKLRESRIKRE